MSTTLHNPSVAQPYLIPETFLSNLDAHLHLCKPAMQFQFFILIK